MSPQEAASLLRRITALPGHQFWTDHMRFAESPEVARSRVIGHRQVTEAHLVALAIRNGGRLTTFDTGVHALVPTDVQADAAVEVLSPAS